MESLLPHLPQQRISYVFFFVHATLEIHAAGDSLHDILSDLEEIFPDALCIKGWKGLVHYHVRGACAPRGSRTSQMLTSLADCP